MIDNENRKWLYDKLTKDGYNLGKYEEFDSYMSDDEESRKWVYDTAASRGYDVGKDFDEFTSIMSAPQPEVEQKAPSYAVVDRYKKTEPETSSYSDRPLTEADKAAALATAQEIVDRGQSVVDTTKENLEALQSRKPLDVVEPKTGYNQESGKFETQYETAEGETYKDGFDAAVAQEGEDIAQQMRQRQIQELKGRAEDEIRSIYEQKAAELEGMGFWENLFYQMGRNRAGSVTAAVPGVKDPYAYSEDEQERMRSLSAAQDMLKNAERIYSALRDLRKSEGLFGGGFADWNNVTNFARGVKDTATDMGTWDMGAGELNNAVAMLALKDKLESGEELTYDEMILAEASLLNAEWERIGEKELPNAYQAAQTTVEMLPFMAQMALVPGNGFGGLFAGKVAEKLGREGLKAIAARAAARITGDILTSAALASTAQGMSTAADIIERSNGTLGMDENGRLMFTDGKSLGQSVYEGVTAATIENFTEMALRGTGSFIGGKLASGFERFANPRTIEMLQRASRSSIVQGISRFEQKTKWGGPLEEMLEEEVNIVLNSGFVGDSKLKDLVDWEKQEDIILGVGVFGATVSAMKTVGFAAMDPYYRNQMDAAGAEASRRLGGRWAEVRSAIDNASDQEALAEVLRGYRKDGTLTEEQKRSVLKYGMRRAQWQGYNTGLQIAREEMGEFVGAGFDAFQAGMDMEGAERNAAARRHRDAYIALTSSAEGVGLMNSLQEAIRSNADESVLNDIYESASDAIRPALTEYFASERALQGILYQSEAEAKKNVAQFDAEADAATVRHENGVSLITTATYKGNQVYVVNDNGSTAVILQMGKSVQVSSQELTDKQSHYPNEYKETYRAAVEQSVKDEIDFALNHHEETKMPEVGSVIRTMDQSGEQKGLYVTAVEGDKVKYVPAVYDAATGSEIPQSGVPVQEMTVEESLQLQDMWNEGASAMTEAPVETEMPMPQEATESAPYVPSVGETFDVVLDGESYRATAYGESPDGRLSVELDRPYEGKTDLVLPEDAIVVPVPSVPGEATPASAQNVQPKQEEQKPQSALDRIPKNEQGEPAYDQTDAETAWDAIMEQTEGDAEMAAAVVASTIADKQKALEDAQTAEIPQGATVQEKIAAQKTHKQNIENAQKELAHWQEIAGVEAKRAEMAAHENNVASKMQGAETEAVESTEIRLSDELDENGRNRKEVYNRHTTAKQPTETAEASQNTEQNEAEQTSAPALEGEISARTATPTEIINEYKEPLRRVARNWGKKLGVKVHVLESLDEVPQQMARDQIVAAESKRQNVPGWYDRETGEVYIYMPHVNSMKDITSTLVHEVVSHHGLKALLGEKGYDRLCDQVYKMLPLSERKKWLKYPGVNGNHRKAADEYIAHLSEGVRNIGTERSVWQRIVAFVRKALRDIGLELEASDRELEDLLRASYANLRKNAKKGEVLSEESNTTPITSITDAAAQSKPSISFNVKTEESLEAKIRNFMQTEEGEATNWTQEQVESVIEETSALINALDEALRGNRFYDEFADREPTTRLDWRDGEWKPIVTWTRNNIEYKYDMSADLLCINNDGLEAVLSSPEMAAILKALPTKKKKDGANTYELSMTSSDYTTLYNILDEMGFVVPCKGCFDAAARLKMLPSVAQKFAQDVNRVVDERNQDPEAYDEALRQKGMKAKEQSVEGFPVTAGTKMDAIRVAVAGDNLTEHISWTDLLSAEGQTKMRAERGGVFRAWQRTGAGRPKDKLLPEPYIGDITTTTTTIIGSHGQSTPSFRDLYVNQGTGLRRNSHSEMRPILAADEIQFIRDAFLRNLTVFKYMKELDDVRLFGKMGVKYNMSFFPAHVRGAKVSGLDANGDYIASSESVGAREFPYKNDNGKTSYDGMKGWEEAKKYVNKDVSLSSVVFSVPHLIKALTDVPTPSSKEGLWGSLIPFHSSGATTQQLAEQGLGVARANGVGHGFDEAMFDYGKGVTNFEAVQNDRFGEGWVVVSGKKAGENVEPGHKLEFVNGTHYYNKNLGVHLFAKGYILEDEVPESERADIGSAESKEQYLKEFTVDYNDKVREIGTPTSYKDAADYYLETLAGLGLIPRFDFEVEEGTFLQMCEDAKVDPKHPKLGWKGEGNGWNPTDAESYYSLFCDYGMTDPATGEWAPHNPVGYTNEKGEREFRMPDNTVDIIREGVQRYTDIREKEEGMVSAAIREFANTMLEQGRLTEGQILEILGSEEIPESNESQVSFKVVEDPMKVAELEAGEKIEAYRSAYINENGKLYSPMASRLKSTQKGTKQQKNEAAQMGQWDEAVENPGMVDADGRITILDEDNGSTKVAYNPYGHCCVNSKMNDQFKRAWKRDNLYTVKVVAPASELTDGYKADHAKDAVGVHRWKTGAVGNQLPDSKRREILLTRWMKNVEVLPWEEVAQDWIQTLEGEDVDVPFNVVPRKILNMLAEGGVNIVAPENGMESAAEAYEQWLADPEGYVGDTALPEHIQKLNKGVKGNLNNTYTYQEWKEKEGDVSFSVKKKAPKTELPEDKSSFKGSVVSDADRAKVLNNLDILQKEYEENSSKRQKTFISDLSKALLLRNNGNNSNYADYIAVSGEEVTIRLSDHNVSVADMDNAGKSNGISIVIGRKHNDGIKGFGNSHIVEFYYNDKKLHSAEGNPYTEIIKSLKQTVYSGEYKDTTGLAERQEVNGISFRIGRNGEFSKENNDIRFSVKEGGLTKNLVEENFGGIWIEDKKEFAKFASAIINNGIEENGEGVTYTDNFFYAYYRNINGDAIPFASVYLNSQESQDVVNKVSKEIGNGREEGGIKKYIDTAIERYEFLQNQNYAYNGNNSGVSNRGGNVRLGDSLLQKGRYYYRPDLFVKARRADRFGLIDEEDNDLSFRTAPSFKDGEQLPIQGEKGAYFVEGLTGDYQNADYLLDAFRSKYPEYLAELNEDKTAIVVEPWSKYLGPTTSKKAQAKQDAHRERVAKSVKQAVRDAAEKMHIPVALTTSDKQKGKRAKAKGWYDTKTHEIVIVVDNHSSVYDALATVLHEGVAHYGLRKMFGSNFDNFLDNVFKDADKAVRQRIIDFAEKNGWDFREATEEYLASLAEDADFENAVNQGWFHKIKKFFFHMLSDLGIADAHLFPIGDNELRYILWRSYENLKNPLSMHNVFTTAEDVVMQNRLMVGPYAKEMARIQSLGKVSTSELTEGRGYVAEGVAGNSKNSDLRFSVTPRDRAIARDSYERTVASSGFQMREAMQDSLLGLRRMMEAISGKNYLDISGNENAYFAANRLSSVNAAEQEEFRSRLMQPLFEEISRLARTEAERIELVDYMMAKHGLERNVVLAERDALEQSSAKGSKISYADALAKNREKDYSGLTTLMQTPDVAGAEQAAQDFVDSYESTHYTDDLWNLINAATDKILDKTYKSGLITRESLDHIRGMFKYYIPLRGWEETRGEGVYAYINSNDGVAGAGKPIKHAKGRTSVADDPIAYIQLMADTAISQGNRNLVKQHLLTFVNNHPSDLVSVSDLWLEKDAVTGEWKPVFPDIDVNDTPEMIEQAVEAFEAQMEQLASQDPDRYKRGKDAKNIPYRLDKNNLKEHQIIVRRLGAPYVLTINGNPRAAQAVNGLTNPDADNSAVMQSIINFGRKINRWRSVLVTTGNIAFIARNLVRDTLYTWTTIPVKENARYTGRFYKYWAKNNVVKILSLFHKYLKGNLDMNNKTDRYFKEFMDNGGETGYTSLKDIEGYKKETRSAIKGAKSSVRKAASSVAEGYSTLNRAIENCARFAAYVASRESGRDVARSVYDAKEVSLNFNTKGSGGKFFGAQGQSFAGNAAAFVSSLGRLMYLFWNPSVQALMNFSRLAKRHTGKFLALPLSLFSAGFARALFAGDDDEDDYYNLPEYLRRSHMCFSIGKGKWVTIPLPVELAAIYGMGELAASIVKGKESNDPKELGLKVAGQISQIMPIDLVEGMTTSWTSFVPDAVRPIVEAGINKSWTGLPIYREEAFYSKGRPGWTRAYDSTSPLWVNAAKWLNRATGGDSEGAGLIDLNPAALSYIVSGYLGGPYALAMQGINLASSVFGEREFQMRDVPVVSAFIKESDERAEEKRLNGAYYRIKDIHDAAKRRSRILEGDNEEAIKDLKYGSLEEFDASKESQIMDEFDYYDSIIKDLQEEPESPEIREEVIALKRELMERVREIEESE